MKIDLIAKPILEIQLSLGESPVWDHRIDTLYWVDYTEKRIHFFEPETKLHSFFQLAVPPGSVAPTEKGNLLVGYENEIGLFDLKNRTLSTLFSPEKGKSYNHFNDGKCDSRGRFWVGSITESQDWPGSALYMIEGSEKCVQVFDGVTTSNGLAWSSDDKTFYYIDTMTYCVAAFDFEINTGILTNKRTIIDFRGEKGRPDGMTIDEDGFLWIAHWNGGMVSRWNPSTGICSLRVPIPAYNVTSCYFGGKQRDILYITSARVETNESQLKEYPLSGGIFSLQPGTRGLITNFAKGV